MIDLEAIRKRDRDYDDVFEAQASMSKDIAHRLVAWPVADRRALLASVDALAARLAAVERELDALKETRIRELTYVIAEAKRTLVFNEIETREALDDLRAWAVNRKDAIISAALERQL